MNKIGIFMNFWVKNWDADHVKHIKKVSGLGFDILEFQAQALLDMDKSRMDEVRQAAKDNGIELTYSLGLNPKYDVASPDAKVREGGIEYLKRIVERIGYMEGKLLSGVNYAGWGSPDYIVDDKSEIVKHSIESVRQVIKTAEDYDVTYCVEVVNRFEGIVMNTAKEAIEHVKQIDSDKIGILLDTYHMNIEEGSIGDAIRSVGGYLKNFHRTTGLFRARGTLTGMRYLERSMISIIREGSCQSRSSRWAGKSQETSRYGEIWWKTLQKNCWMRRRASF